MVPRTCVCIWDPAGMDGALMGEDEDYTYYHASQQPDPTDPAVELFYPDPAGDAVIAIDKEASPNDP